MASPPDAISLAARFVRALGFEPTHDQRRAFEAVARLLLTQEAGACLVLQGAAGTGKTSLLKAVVAVLYELEAHVVLMAPTGRAAKVLAGRTGQEASTLHKVIYDTETSLSGSVRYRPRRNSDPQDAVYIVDEASMIGEDRGESGGSLLHDLVGYVYGEEPGRKLIFLGDPYQLPPVGAPDSPALAVSYLRRNYGLVAGKVQLTEVRRQGVGSGILQVATALREAQDRVREAGEVGPLPTVPHLPDVLALPDTQAVVDTFLERYDPDDPDSVVAVCYSNGIAAQLNAAIRQRLYDDPEPLVKGDRVMVVKNFYRQSFHALPFIANGDMGLVTRTFPETADEKFGQRWLEALVAFQEPSGRVVDLSATVPTSLLLGKAPNLTSAELKAIWDGRLEELARASDKKPDRKDLKADPYLGALQLKFGYAITGHKAQGGQWRTVIVVFEPYLVNRHLAEDPVGFLRWSYTALTRASEVLYLYNSPFGAVGT
ncbi:MAG: AAA family ATPase [Bacteroidia bacterium]|nr:AAA family ATPase [Bacteroidia bacterium]